MIEGRLMKRRGRKEIFGDWRLEARRREPVSLVGIVAHGRIYNLKVSSEL